MNPSTKGNSITNYIEPKSLIDLAKKTGNTYESIVVIAKRANQIASQTKEELHSKLEEFATSSDNLEEIHENREQIEISRHYEKMPSATLRSTEEFIEEKIYFRNPVKDEPKPLF